MVDSGAPSASDSPVDGDVVVVGQGLDPGTLMPMILPYRTSGQLSRLVMLGPTDRVIREGTLAFPLDLARQVERDAEGKTLTFHLRPDAIWEDGKPVTARDFAYTWQLTCDEKVAANWVGDCKELVGSPDPVRVVDDHTAQVSFLTLRDPLLQDSLLHRSWVAEHVLRGADRESLRGNPHGRAPLSNGPFRLLKWEKDQSLVFEPNPRTSVRSRPHLKRVVVRILPEYTSRLVELENGGIDVLPDLEPSDLARIEAIPHLRVQKLPHNSLTYLGYNLKDSRFADLRVRRAFAHAIDIDAINASVFSSAGVPLGVPAVGTVSPFFKDAYASDILRIPHDPARARALLLEGGWRDQNGDGVVEQQGKPLEFTVLTQASAAAIQKVATLIQNQLAVVGVKVKIQPLEENAFIAAIREKKFEAMLWGYGAEPRLDETIKFHSGVQGRYNWGGYENPQVDRLLEARMVAKDPSEIFSIVKEIQRKVYEDQPVTFVCWLPDLVAMHRRFRGTEVDTFSWATNLEKWWVPKAEQKYP